MSIDSRKAACGCYSTQEVPNIICVSRMSTHNKGFVTELLEKINPGIEAINTRTDPRYA